METVLEIKGLTKLYKNGRGIFGAAERHKQDS